MADFSRLAFIDLETTGGRPTSDRITEIAIVRTYNGVEVDRWESLVYPDIPIPQMIQQMTGINNEMVRNAPSFDELLPVILEMLKDHVVVAHNARFDVGFLRNAYRHYGEEFKNAIVCTVKLSRNLYPRFKRHNLDAIIKRFDLSCEARHRAMGDAAALPQLVAQMRQDFSDEDVLAAMAMQQKLSSMPPHLDPKLFDQMPNEPGVYLFYGESGSLLYVGKSVQIRTRVISHFSSDHSNNKEMRMSQQVHDIEWIVTAGEFSALMLEAELVKERSPLFNRKLRKQKTLYTLHWDSGVTNEIDKPKVVDINAQGKLLKSDSLKNTYGLFRSRKGANDVIKKLKDEHTLCAKQLGLEKGKGACFAYQLKRCKGICCGEEKPLNYQMRLQQALAPIKIKGWPYDGAIGIHEYNEESDIKRIHVISHWLYLGYVSDENDLTDFSFNNSVQLDMDFYRICIGQMQKKDKIIPLGNLIKLNV